MDVGTAGHRTRSTLLLTAVLGLIALAAAMPARAATPFAQISSPGPLERIYAGNELSCQMRLLGDTVLSVYPSTIIPGDCGTFVRTGGTLYMPNFGAHGNTATGDLPAPKQAYTPVSQSPVTGTGTTADPFTVTTVADAGSTGLRITQIDSYVNGESFYRSQITVANSGASQQTAALYHAADCFLAGSDEGYGFVDAPSGGVFCAANANNSPSGRIFGLQPGDAASAGATYVENVYDTVWSLINGSPFPNTCDCASFIDNGVGLEWDITIPAGGAVTRQVKTTVFAPPAITIDDRSVAEGPPAARGVSPSARFVVHLSYPVAAVVRADFVTADDTATSPEDYVASTGTVRIPAGRTSAIINVSISDDALDEPTEMFTVGLSNPTGGATIEDDTAIGRITDNDGPPSVSVGDTSKREGVTHQVPITLSQASGRTVRVNFQTADGTRVFPIPANAPDDYTARSGTVRFLPGDIEEIVLVRTVQDGTQEGDEEFEVRLSAPVFATLGDDTSFAMIDDDDPD